MFDYSSKVIIFQLKADLPPGCDGTIPGRKEDSMAAKKTQKSDQKLCFIGDLNKEEGTLENYKKLVEEPRFICTGCGRTAASDNNLCSPERM